MHRPAANPKVGCVGLLAPRVPAMAHSTARSLTNGLWTAPMLCRGSRRCRAMKKVVERKHERESNSMKGLRCGGLCQRARDESMLQLSLPYAAQLSWLYKLREQSRAAHTKSQRIKGHRYLSS